MVLDRVRAGAALLLLACLALPAYTCDSVSTNPVVSYEQARTSHYPLEREPGSSWLWLVALVGPAYLWPVPFLIYRRRRVPAPVARWVMWLQAVAALPSAFVIFFMSMMGRPAIGMYLALLANIVLFADGVAEASTTRARPSRQGSEDVTVG